jgi:hypothetical protein
MVDATLGTEGGGTTAHPKVSPKGARGPMQVMPGTERIPASACGRCRTIPEAERARVGRDYLAAMQHHYGGDPAKAWAAYNAGPGARQGDSARRRLAFPRCRPRRRPMSARTCALGASAPAALRMAAPDGEDHRRLLFGRAIAQRDYDDPRKGPVREDFQGFEKTEARHVPHERAARRGRHLPEPERQLHRRPARPALREPHPDRRQRRGLPGRRRRSRRPARLLGGPRARHARGGLRQGPGRPRGGMGAPAPEARRSAIAAAARPAVRGGAHRRRRPEQPLRANTGRSRTAKADFWRTTEDGIVADKDGKPVAFRNAKEAAKWAARNQMGGDFELHSWGTNSSRVVLKRRENSTYGAKPPDPAPARRAACRALGDPIAKGASEPRRARLRLPGPASRAPERPKPGEATYTPPPPPEPPRGRLCRRNARAGHRQERAGGHRARPLDRHAVRGAGGSRPGQLRSSGFRPGAAAARSRRPRELGRPGRGDRVEAGPGAAAQLAGWPRRARRSSGPTAWSKAATAASRRSAAPTSSIRSAMDAYRKMIEDRATTRPASSSRSSSAAARPTSHRRTAGFVREANERDTMQMSSTGAGKGDAGAMSDATSAGTAAARSPTPATATSCAPGWTRLRRRPSATR